MSEKIKIHLFYPASSPYAEEFIELSMTEALLILQTGNIRMLDLKCEKEPNPDYVIEQVRYYYSEKDEKELFIALEYNNH